MNSSKTPLALFDNLEKLDLNPNLMQSHPEFEMGDYSHALTFLKCYRASKGTFNSYRREIEKLLQWSYLIAQKKLKDLRREDIENFVRFCENPPQNWIGTKKPPRFIDKDGKRCPNPEWRPFVATIKKYAHYQGQRPDTDDFSLSHGAIKELFAILSTFFNYLLQEEYVHMNPVALIRQKSKFIRRKQGPTPIRRLSEVQWQYVIETAKNLAETEPQEHERTLFIMSLLYSLYLRISELTASFRWTPLMNHFQKDHEGNWWFTTVGKGNKERQIAVSDTMLEALKRWRKFRNLSHLPSPADQTPLLPKTKGKGPITSTNYIRRIVQNCFDDAALRLRKNNLVEEAETLHEATVHWLRHTGISDDVKHRPREHVRDDAGHSSSAITDRYIDVEKKARHRSAKDKRIVLEVTE